MSETKKLTAIDRNLRKFGCKKIYKNLLHLKNI